MPSFNKVMLMGHLTRDPETRQLSNGSVTDFGLAVNRTWYRGEGQNRQKVDEVAFIDCTAWGRRGEAITQYLGKGKPIFVEGHLKMDQWEDKTTGQNRTKLKVMVENFQFVGSGEKQEGSKTAAVSTTGGQTTPTIGDDDIPF